MTEEWPLAPLERGAYGCICADPPWNHKGNSVALPGRNARRHYATMSLAEIAALPVADLCAADAYLFFWIPGQFLVIGAHLPIFKAWSFKPTAMAFTWAKFKKSHNADQLRSLPLAESDLHVGMGHTTRKNAEFCVMGRRGKPKRMSASVREIILSPLREHSRKPDEYRDRVEAYVGPDVRIAELFARESRPRWDTWGNEAGKFDAA